MAAFVVSHSVSLSRSLPCTFAAHASLKPPSLPKSPTVRFTGGLCHRKVRGWTVVTRAGPSTSSYIFAFALPFSLLAITILTSIRIADKLDREFLEEMALNEAIMEADEYEDEDDIDDNESFVQEEPALSHARNRPKREA